MEQINQFMNRLLGRKDFQERYMQLKHEILSHPEVQSFLREHEGAVSEAIVERSLNKLYEFIQQSKDCRRCPSLDSCVNLLKGYHPHLVLQGNAIDIQYDRCPTKVKHDERKRQESLIQSLFMPREILRASLSDVDLADDGRMKAIELAGRFVANYEPGKKNERALFIWSVWHRENVYVRRDRQRSCEKKYFVSHRLCPGVFP